MAPKSPSIDISSTLLAFFTRYSCPHRENQLIDTKIKYQPSTDHSKRKGGKKISGNKHLKLPVQPT